MFNTKLTEHVGKPKELLKSLKTVGLASIKSLLTNIWLKTEDNVTNFDDNENANIFKNLFCTVADDLVANLFHRFLRFGLPSVRKYHEKIL